MSEIRANTISDLAGTGPVTLTKQSAAKAWVNFNGTGTIAARDSFNLSSLVDNGTGDYTVNFSSAFGTGDYAASGTAGTGAVSTAPFSLREFTFLSGSSRFGTNFSSGGTTGAADAVVTTFSVHGDLA